MAPYVRKSFRKHFKDGLNYIEEKETDFVDDIPEDTSIEDEKYKTEEKAYKYAMDMTKKELKQAVEGMYHNLKY